MSSTRSLIGMAATAALVLAACSDVSPGPTGQPPGGNSDVAQCGDETITIAVNPWEGAAANANVVKGVMEQQMGCTVKLKEVNEQAQFPGMARGTIDATLEVWPSGHFDDRILYIDKEGSVVDGGELGITGNIGWFVPSYVIEEHPEFATWEGFKGNADLFATAQTGDKGRFLGADTTYSIYDEVIIQSLGLDLEVVYSGGETQSLTQLDRAVADHEPILMYWWTPQWSSAKYDLVEVQLPPFDDECQRIASEDPGAVGYDCDYAVDTLYKAFSAGFEEKDPAAFAFLLNFQWTEDDQNSVALEVVQEGTDRAKAAQTWIDANEDVWSSWLPPASS